MVVGERFAWAHLPKTGGSATEELFKLFPHLVRFADPLDSNDKHALFRDRQEMIAGKQLAMNLRRLPFWVLSRAQYVARHGVWPDYEPIPMDSPQRLSESSFPDSRLLLFTDGGRFEIDRWLRMEHLEEDFLDFVGQFTEITAAQREQVMRREPVNVLDYDRELENWFTPQQIRSMYATNPTWAQPREMSTAISTSLGGRPPKLHGAPVSEPPRRFRRAPLPAALDQSP